MCGFGSQFTDLMTKLVSSADKDSAFCAVEEAILCIMHGGIIQMKYNLNLKFLIDIVQGLDTSE
jgi:hypothetical protein